MDKTFVDKILYIAGKNVIDLQFLQIYFLVYKGIQQYISTISLKILS
jgi:hypothetical protein